MELLFLPLVPFVVFPPLAWLVAALLAWSASRRPRLRGRRAVRTVVALWLLYGVYESSLWVWIRHQAPPVRVDLLVIAPLLGVATVSVWAMLWRADRRSR